jgi:stress response protein YsnF
MADDATLHVEPDAAFGATGVVMGGGGWRGRLFPAPDAERDGLVVARVLVRPDDGGPAVIIPAAMLEDRGDGGFFLPLDRAAAASYGADRDEEDEAKILSGERLVIPVLAETVSVGRRLVETGGGVRVTKRVRERAEVIEEALLQEDVTVERVAVNRIVDAAPAQRQEGDTLVIPVLEEVLVIEKRLLLREEVRVTRRQRVVREPRTVTLREERAEVERMAPGADGGAGGPETEPARNQPEGAGRTRAADAS